MTENIKPCGAIGHAPELRLLIWVCVYIYVLVQVHNKSSSHSAVGQICHEPQSYPQWRHKQVCFAQLCCTLLSESMTGDRYTDWTCKALHSSMQVCHTVSQQQVLLLAVASNYMVACRQVQEVITWLYVGKCRQQASAQEPGKQPAHGTRS